MSTAEQALPNPNPASTPAESGPMLSSLGKKLSAEMLNRLSTFINEANEQDAVDQVAQLRQARPEATNAELVEQLIYDKCIQTATSGAMTAGTALIPGVGPAIALTVGVATDIGVTFKLQAELVLEIAAVYGREITDEEKRTILLGVTGVNMGSDFMARSIGRNVARQATKLLAGHTAVKAIPYLGVAFSAGLNMALTYAVGQRAIEYFGGEQKELKTWEDTLQAMTGLEREKLAQWLTEAALQAYALLYPKDEPQPTSRSEAAAMAWANVTTTAVQVRQQAQDRWLATKSNLLDSVHASDYFSPKAQTLLDTARQWEPPQAVDLLPNALKKGWLEAAEGEVAEAEGEETSPLEVVAVLTPHDTTLEAVRAQIAQAQAHVADRANWGDVWLFGGDAEEVALEEEEEVRSEK